MTTIEEFGTYETAWCPGCGNHAILKAVKQAFAGMGLAPHEVLLVSGIGQAAKLPQYLRCNMFNGLHGRALPAATGARLANPGLKVFAVSGDGCTYGEGGNHFLAALRRNPDITLLAHDNQIYGLTKGQASPTTTFGQKTKAQPAGQPSAPLNPVALAVAMRVSFVARAFSGEAEHLVEMITQAANTPGFALVDVLQPCVSFNKVNTFGWYKERCYKLDKEHDPTDWGAAMRLADEFGERIPLGVIWQGDREPFEAAASGKAATALATHRPDSARLEQLLRSFA